MAVVLQPSKQWQLPLGALLGALPALVWLVAYLGFLPSGFFIAAVAAGYMLYFLTLWVVLFALLRLRSRRLSIGLLSGFVASTGVMVFGIIVAASHAAAA